MSVMISILVISANLLVNLHTLTTDIVNLSVLREQVMLKAKSFHKKYNY
jgi:hypothetical protein